MSAYGQLPRRVTKRYHTRGFRKGTHGKTVIILTEDGTDSAEEDRLTAYRLEHRSGEEQFCGDRSRREGQ